MTDLLLQPTGSPLTEYEVIADGRIWFSRISLVGALQNKPWVWSIDFFPFSEGHEPVHGSEGTREAAMQSFAKSWFGN